ncbi:Metallophos domain-containing protein [Cephalotus follicularis]|uniref:Purple acid phosphatase n=1 Tax=Cephalotus follicularis TaxID=3775 RepID=A0A1Q3AV14_CEPFO|nr:Metallophos domain-containing protein [Cephalotus follicularis]
MYMSPQKLTLFIIKVYQIGPRNTVPQTMSTVCNQKMLKTSLFTALLGLFMVPALTELQRFEEPSKPDGSLSLLVVGDWGRRGRYNQSNVAYQMGVIGKKLDIDFIISTGDNFYDDGLTGVDDPAFHESFADIYTADSLQKPWYAVLGNHDYRGDVEAQLSLVLREMDRRWLCMRSFVVNAEIAEFFFVDTTPFVDKYFIEPENHQYDWRGVFPREDYLTNLLRDVDLALKQSKAKWKIVVGHHTIKSAGHHGNTDELAMQLLPILKANNVDLYINGHDHCLEHISSTGSPLQFLTSGGGSKSWRGDVDWWNPQEMKFYYDGQGFMSVQITQTEVDIKFYDIMGNVLHKWSISKQLYLMS